MFSDWLISKKSSPPKTTYQNELKLGKNHLWKDLYKKCSSCPEPLTNMAATGNFSF